MSMSVFSQHFAALPDPRVERAKKHSLHEVLVIALLAMLSGAEGWQDMEEFGYARQTWLRERLGFALENGPPSDDTFRRVFAALDPDAFQQCFRDFTRALAEEACGQTICVDGKTLRHSFDRACGQKPVHLVRAWAQEYRLVLGALATEEKSNEIPAVRALLPFLSLQGALVTADAEHTQKETASQIVSLGADYLLSLKQNHLHLYEDVQLCFASHERHPAAAREWEELAPGRSVTSYREVDKGHGRVECRQTTVLQLAEDDPQWNDILSEWPQLKCLVRVTRTRQVRGVVSEETAYYLCSRRAHAKQMGRHVRDHWSIENGLHYVLDISFHEDDSRVRLGNAPRNLATLRDLCINLIRKAATPRRGMKLRRKRAGWDPDSMLELIA